MQINEEKLQKILNKKYAETDFLVALNKDSLDLKDFAALVCADISDKNFEKLATKAKSLTIKRFGYVKGLYIPLYLSSSCNNVCIYCGFRKDNEISRKTLAFDEIFEELTDIFNKGFRNVLFVSGECDDVENIQYLERAVLIAKQIGFHSISVELGALSKDVCKQIANSGAESFVLYQETYHKPTYQKVHLEGKKTDYEYRIKAPERAASGGFRKVLFGFLCGLYDAKFEALAMFEHISFIRKKFWDIEIGISLPRITKAEGVDWENFRVDDRTYARILMAYRLAFNDLTISLSTREEEKFRDGMSDICVTHLSVESKTMPGGYHSCSDKGLEQFAVRDNRRLKEIADFLKKKGYDICVKDWQKELSI